MGRGKDIEEDFKDDHALILRSKGWTYKAIGEDMGVTRQMAHLRVKKASEVAADRRKELAEGIVEGDLATLDTIVKKMTDVMEENDSPTAAGAIISALNRKAKLLGTDSPEKKEITGTLTLEQLIQQSMDGEKEDNA